MSDADEALRSDARFVLVEAPAGCGKTYTACAYAREICGSLPDGRQVLVLAHTNAAVEEFSRRTRDVRSKIRVTTFDSLALQLVAPYAEALGLPAKLRPGDIGDRVPYAAISYRAMDLLHRCPIVARTLSAIFPVVILDEHQDASRTQHAIAIALRDAGSKVRGFGDPMQAIFDDDRPPWTEICEDADTLVSLSTPHRWRANPDLGQWILSAREALKKGSPVPIDTAPDCVKIISLGDDDVGYGSGNPRDYSRLLSSGNASNVVILTARTKSIDMLRQASANRATIYEGSVFQHLYDAFDQFELNRGSPKELAMNALDLIGKTFTGLVKARRQRIERSLTREQVEFGRLHLVTPLLKTLKIFYEQPNIVGAGAVARSLLSECPEFLTVHRPAAWQILSSILPYGADAYEQLQAGAIAHKSARRRPAYSVGTIQRIKGLEFERVIIFNVSQTHFTNDEYGRKLLYIALSRAKASLTLIVPKKGQSHLLP